MRFNKFSVRATTLRYLIPSVSSPLEVGLHLSRIIAEYKDDLPNWEIADWEIDYANKNDWFIPKKEGCQCHHNFNFFPQIANLEFLKTLWVSGTLGTRETNKFRKAFRWIC